MEELSNKTASSVDKDELLEFVILNLYKLFVGMIKLNALALTIT